MILLFFELAAGRQQQRDVSPLEIETGRLAIADFLR
jgi:hypothetical protein